jgi:hypothetical protein
VGDIPVRRSLLLATYGSAWCSSAFKKYWQLLPIPAIVEKSRRSSHADS